MSGISLAFFLHLQNRSLADRLARALGPVTTLVENKFYMDEIYQACIVEPLRMLGRVLYNIDRFLVDGLVNLAGFLPQVPGDDLDGPGHGDGEQPQVTGHAPIHQAGRDIAGERRRLGQAADVRQPGVVLGPRGA